MSTILSIVIPILNEIDEIKPFLERLLSQSIFDNEIIFVDGGSMDGSYEYLSKNKSCKVIRTARGRAHQQNEGAKIASSSLLYFLHVDTVLPYGFDKIITHAFKQGSRAGSFQLRFSSTHLSLKIVAFATKFNYPFCRGGDQSLFIGKTLFEELQGFNEDYLVCEDGELIDRIYAKTMFRVLPQNVITSSRRFEKNGVLRLQFHFTVIHIMRKLGRPPKALYKYYSRFVK